MSDITVGSVSVEVVPDARRFPPRLARQVNPEAAKIGAEFGRLFGAAAEREIARGVRDGLNAGSRDTAARGAGQGDSYGGSFARALKARLEAAFRSLPDIELNADSTGADREIAAIRSQLAELRDKRIGIDIDAAEASRRVDELQQHLRLLSQQSPEVDVRIDSGRAAAELARFQAEVNRLDGQSIDVDVDVDTAAASAQLALLNGQARGAGSGFTALLGAALLLGPALIPIGAVGVAALGAIVTGALAAAGAVGVLLLALVPVIAAVQAVRAAHDQSAAAARGSTTAHLQMASAVASVTSAQQGLKSAEQDAADARVRAADAVAAARRQLADAVRDAARDQAQAARAIEDAERALADAQRASLDAQRDLDDARKQAARDMEDFATRVADGVLSERDATLRLQEARLRLAETQADPKATDLERQRALLAVDQAVQGLKDQQAENRRLAQDKATADKAGVEGSDLVRQAQDRVRESQEKLAATQRGVSDATTAAARKQQDDAAKVAEAQRGVEQAVRASEIQQRKSAESIASAQQAVVAAQRSVQQASQAAGASGGAAMDKVRDKMAALSPAGQGFVTFLTDKLLPAFGGLSKTAQQGFLPGLQDGIESLMPLIPSFEGFVGDLAATLGDLAREAGKALDGPVFRKFFSYLSGSAGPILTSIAHSLGNFAKGFAGLVPAFAPITDLFFKGLEGLSKRFADFGAGADKNAGFQGFLAYIKENGPKVVDMFGAIAGAVGHIITALAPLAPVIVEVVTNIAHFISSLDPALIRAIVIGIGAFAVGMQIVGVVLAVIASPIILVVAAIAALAAGLIYAYQKSETFRDVVSTVWAAVKDSIASQWSTIKEIFTAIKNFITVTLPAAFTSGVEALKNTWTGFKTHVSDIWDKIKSIFDKVWSYIKDTVAAFFRREIAGLAAIWTGFKNGVSATWDLISAIFDRVWSYIKNTVRAAFEREIAGLAAIWTGLKATISAIWDGKFGIKTIFDALGGYIRDHVVDLFGKGVAAIGRAWDGLKELAAAPVRFVIDTIINDGIIGSFNAVAKHFPGAPHLDAVPLPKSLQAPQKKADGGYISGPGGPRDDLIPALLSNGEYVINAAAVQRVGIDLLDFLNRGGAIGGDPGGVARFATGGLVAQALKWLPSVDPLPYVWGGVGPGGYDCSGLSSEVLNRITGRPSYHRNFTTSSDLRQSGFAPGFGQFTLGVNPGQHMVGTLAGLGFEARSTATGIFVGPSATDPLKMRQQWYLAQLPGGELNETKGMDWSNPLAGVFDGIFDSFHFAGPWADLALSMPKALVSAVGDFVGNAIPDVPGFADGGLVKYDQGGYLPPGVTTVVNKTGRPEPVLTSGQWASMREGGGKPSVTINQTVNNPAPEAPSMSLTRSMRAAKTFGLLPVDR